MLKEIFLFELNYRKKRPATWVYFFIMVFIGLLTTSTDVIQIGGSSNILKENSPYSIAFIMSALAAVFGTFMASAIMGVSVLRDFEHKTDAMFFTTPIKRSDYLLGRFAGSFLVLIFVLSGIVIGMMLGAAWPGITEDFWPAREPEKLLPFNFESYWRPFVIFVIPNALICGAIFFLVGGLAKRMIFVYLQAMLFLVLQGIADTVLGDLDNKKYAAWLDPFGARPFSLLTEYWTNAEKNSLQVPFTDEILANRILWIAIGIIALIAIVKFFATTQSKTGIIWRKPGIDLEFIKNTQIKLPKVTLQYGFGAQLKELWTMTVFYTKNVIKDVPFIGIIVTGILVFLINLAFMDSFNDIEVIPTTYRLLSLLEGSFFIFFFIVVIMYSGELIWKERDVKMHLIQDATPVPTALPMIAKFLSIFLSLTLVTLLLVFCSVLAQLFQGYFNIELDIYFKTLWGEVIPKFMIWTLLAFFVQVMVNNKIAGHAVMIIFFIGMAVASNLGLEHPMLRFNSGGLGMYSDMNKFGHFVTPFSWFGSYWTAFTMILFGISVLMASRGAEELFKLRLRIGRYRLSKPIMTLILVGLVTFIATGAYIYNNTNKINKYMSSDEVEELRGDYEKTLKKYADLPQPRIVDTYLEVDIFPEERDFKAEGYFVLKNKTDKPLKTIYIQENSDSEITLDYLKFDRETKLDSQYTEKFGFRIYELAQALNPGDSTKMSFKTTFETKGFVAGGSNTQVVENGTFFNNTYFLSIGYNEGFELSQDDTRRKQDLEPKERMREQDDAIGLGQNLIGDDADEIDFEIIMSTSPDQIAIAPGYLQKEWEKDGRRYFHYKMDAPMFNFYSMVSARYEVKKEEYKGINLEIYYHPGHEYNLDRMMNGMKASLDYYQANFSPYQHKQVRIMEFPRYSSFAQSFANTIPFSEGIGFIQKINDEDGDVDMPFYVTAHEVAHQWWGHQVAEAKVKGNAMLSESMSQYSALMVMKQAFTKEQMQKFLKYEQNNYLRGRSTEDKKEQPLSQVESQGYIHYNKGSLVMYALQDYVGEETVNRAFSNYIKKWNTSQLDSNGRYPTSIDMLAELKAVTPDSLMYLYKDLFETITLYELKTEDATYTEIDSSNYQVELKLSAEKFRADGMGEEKPVDINEWVWVGVYGKKEKGKERLIYYQRHKITQKETMVKINVGEKPDKAGIDPLNILIDRHPDDNTKRVKEKEEEA